MTADYEMADVFELTTPEQLKALGDPLRQKILALLLERAATTNQLAKALESPTSTIAHHLKVLHEAGLITIVRTRQVRAITERSYGRVAHTYLGISSGAEDRRVLAQQLLHHMVEELPHMEDDDELNSVFIMRLTKAQAHEFTQHIKQLTNTTYQPQESGEKQYGLVSILYRADLPQLPADEEDPEQSE
ncbi:MAG: helix-turn-helix domain-containing protein [Chloroflexi bacterium AL-W]|nr:helix-turn-helix domain-containing protein [Chloroflexi bacterium AL-N10]NOK78530.1 helix-turn-helix domain-containing protein [Chloroflexi bacterium AL-N5]NOK85614.1 helix-turn-helix domain-containing protein [Chloroflexi bacterium AL-W]NOK92528.1 helix-turn-helix domain-containing protein [Chloroflexi bacterium AL-N15]